MSLETKIFDILGIEDNNREKSAHLIPQYKELANKFPKATIWLKGDEPYYDGLGVVVGESEDLVAVEKQNKDNPINESKTLRESLSSDGEEFSFDGFFFYPEIYTGAEENYEYGGDLEDTYELCIISLYDENTKEVGDDIGSIKFRVFFEENKTNPFSKIEDIYVDNLSIYAEYRNKGYGTRILKGLAKYFNHPITLNPDNSEAERLYKRIGKVNKDGWRTVDNVKTGGVFPEYIIEKKGNKTMVIENKKTKRLQSVREARKLKEKVDDNDWSKLKPLTEKEANLVIEQAVKSGTTIEDIQIHQEGKTTYLVVPIYEFDDDGYDSWIKFIRSTSIEHQYGHDSEWFVIPRGFKIKRSSAGKTIYKATVGFIIEIEIDGTKKKAYVGENSGEGVIYKDYKAFESSEGICYIPEYGFRNESEFDHQRYGDLENKLIGFEEDGYTRNMLEKIVEEHNKETGDTLSSESLFEILEWAFPESYLDDREIDDGLDESLGNKKIYNSSDYFSFSNPEGASIFETEYSQFDGEYYPEDCFEVILDESAIDLRLNDVITIDLKDYGTIQAKVLLIDPNSDNILVAVIN